MSEKDSTTPSAADKTAKPAKPYPEFPLFPHATGRWAKKIRGRLVYFGPWDDPDGALRRYNEQKEALHAGRKPRPDPDALTVKDAANSFLNTKKALLDAGELSSHTFAKYVTAGEVLVAHIGKARLVADLDPTDFAALREKMARRWGPLRLGDMIQHVRSIFKHVFDAGLVPAPVRFGPGFKRPAKKVLRIHKAAGGPKTFTAAEVRKMLDAAGTPLRAMILLGINCGFGNNDCATLPLSALDLDAGVIDFPRPKTGIPRRCSLWPETLEAIHVALAMRAKPKSEAVVGLVFLTRCGDGWANAVGGGPIGHETRKLLDSVGINGHRNYYALRHTFRTVADGAKDQPAADYIMGHEVAHMSSVYRETIGDERLRAVTEHVRTWLFSAPDLARKDERQPISTDE
jgi:integrase